MNMGMGMDMGFPKMHFPKFPKMTAKDFAGGSVLAACACVSTGGDACRVACRPEAWILT